MDFLRRLFGDRRSAPVDGHETAPEPQTESVAPTANNGTDEKAVSRSDIAWHKSATDLGGSAYRGELDGVHVATIVKRADGETDGQPWHWQLEVPADGAAAGNARRLKDAKPAVAVALGAWQP